MDTEPLQVLVVEDEELTAQAHAAYVRRLPGFAVAGTALTGVAALDTLARRRERGQPVQLVLLDMNLPDLHGLDIARAIRGAGADVDVLVITADNQLATVRSAAHAGIVGYLVKPFTYADFAAKMRSYQRFRRVLAGGAPDQEQIDRALAELHAAAPPPLPKGMSAETLEDVAAVLRRTDDGLSASEVGGRLDVSRVTARRYLEHLVALGDAVRRPRHGSPGRPELEYSWAGR